LTYFPICGILSKVLLEAMPHCRRQQVPDNRRKDKPPAEEKLFFMEFLSPCVRMWGVFSYIKKLYWFEVYLYIITV